MTAHIFVILFIQLLFLFIQKKPGNSSFQASLNILIIYLLLPLSFPGITVIADFFFEAFTDNLLWFSLVFVPLWAFGAYYTYRNLQVQNEWHWISRTWSVCMSVLLLLGYLCAIFTSHHESGRTPLVSDSCYLTGYFIGVHVAVIIAFALQGFLLSQCNWRSGYTWVKGLFALIAGIIYLVILFDLKTQHIF